MKEVQGIFSSIEGILGLALVIVIMIMAYRIWKEGWTTRSVASVLGALIVFIVVISLVMVDLVDFSVEEIDRDLADSTLLQRFQGAPPSSQGSDVLRFLRDTEAENPAPPAQAPTPIPPPAPQTQGDLQPSTPELRVQCWHEAYMPLANRTSGGAEIFPADVQGSVRVENRGFFKFRRNEFFLSVPEMGLAEYPITSELGGNLEDAPPSGSGFVGTGSWPTLRHCPLLAAQEGITLDEPLGGPDPTPTPAATTDPNQPIPAGDGLIYPFAQFGPLELGGDLKLFSFDLEEVKVLDLEEVQGVAYACGWWRSETSTMLVNCVDHRPGGMLFSSDIVMGPMLPPPPR